MPATRRAKRPRGTVSAAEEAFALQLRAEGITMDREYRFHPTRRWRFDFAWPARLIAVEIEGVTFLAASLGRHQRPGGFEQDCEKYAEALIRGWRVLRVTPRQVRDGTALAYLRTLIDITA